MVSTDYILKFLNTQPLLNGLTDKQIGFLRSFVQELTLTPGDCVIQENEKSNDIYFIVSGSCDVVKTSPSGSQFVIEQLNEGDVFGEVAFIDDKPRSSTIRANTLSMLLKLSVSELEKTGKWLDFDYFLRGSTFNKLMENVIIESASKIRKTNLKFLDTLKSKINHAELQNDFGAFFVFIITFFSTYNLILSIFSFKKAIYSPFELVSFSIILLACTMFFVVKRNIPLASVGITLKNSLRSFLETIPIIFFSLLSVGAIYAYITES